MYSIGIDLGSVATKAAIFNGKKIIAQNITPTGWSPKESGTKLFQEILSQNKIKTEEIKSIVATGYGRVSLPFIDKKVTEITCHAKGAYFIDSKIRTVIDIGGQDSKVLKMDEKGNVLDFLMNDKCAAGTGRFLQVMATALGIEVGELSKIAKGSDPENISSMCTVFAESEVISLIARGASKESIASGLLMSVCKRTSTLVSKVGSKNKVFFSGGVSKNQLLVEFLSKKLHTEIFTTKEAQYLGAIGAAIIGFGDK